MSAAVKSAVGAINSKSPEPPKASSPKTTSRACAPAVVISAVPPLLILTSLEEFGCRCGRQLDAVVQSPMPALLQREKLLAAASLASDCADVPNRIATPPPST